MKKISFICERVFFTFITPFFFFSLFFFHSQRVFLSLSSSFLSLSGCEGSSYLLLRNIFQPFFRSLLVVVFWGVWFVVFFCWEEKSIEFEFIFNFYLQIRRTFFFLLEMEKETQKEKWTRGDYLEFSKSSNITFEKMRICQKLGLWFICFLFSSLLFSLLSFPFLLFPFFFFFQPTFHISKKILPGTICFYYSVDGKSNEEDFFFTSLDFGVCILKRWVHILQQHSCEICSPSLSVRVKEREKIQNGNEKKKEKEKEKESVCLVTGFFELCVGLGICIIGWLFLYRPRQYIILQTNNLLNDWQIQMNGGKVWSSLWRKKTISRVPSLARFWEWTLRGSLLEFLWANRLTFLPVVIPFDVSLGLERGEGEGERERERGRERRERREEKEEKEDVDPQLEKKNKKEIIQHHQTNKERENPLSRKVMVPIGGGKDALTLVELLRNCLSFPSHQIVLFYLDDDINEWEMNWRVRRLLKATGVLQCVRFVFFETCFYLFIFVFFFVYFCIFLYFCISFDLYFFEHYLCFTSFYFIYLLFCLLFCLLLSRIEITMCLNLVCCFLLFFFPFLWFLLFLLFYFN